MSWEQQLPSIGMVAMAGALGSMIGLEREFAGKPAGLRTHIFVSAAAALLMLLGDAVVDEFQQENAGNINVDPIRIIQAIVVGISFLGAGTIIHQGGDRVEGLTTAASILFTAGVGIAVAARQVILATGASILAVIVLWAVGRVERHFNRARRGKDR